LQAFAAAQLFRHKRLALCLPRQKGGKTELGVRLAHDLTALPTATSALFLAKSHRAAKKAVREKYLRLFDPKVFSVNNELVYLKKFPTSANFIESVDKDPDKIRGGTYHYVHWSEVAFSKFEFGATVKDIFDKIINPALSETKGYCLLESTNNGKNGWYDFWNDAETFGFKRLRINLSDMVYLGLISPEEYEEIRSTTQPDVFRQEYECEWVTFTGKVYDELSDSHLDEKMAGPDGRMVLMAIDWGYHPSATCVLFAYIQGGILHIFDEHYALRELPTTTAQKIRDKLTFWNADSFGSVADHDPSRIRELQLRGIPCSNADKVDVLGNRIQGKELFFFNRIKINPRRCPYLVRDLQAAVWHAEKSDKGELDESQCTWGHFDAEAAFRYLIRKFSEVLDDAADETPEIAIVDPLSAAAVIDHRRRLGEWLLP